LFTAILVSVAALPSGVLAAGEPGTIIVYQDTVPDGPQDFRFNGAGAEFVLDDDAMPDRPSQYTISDVAPGFHAIVQDAVAGWVLDSVSCIDPDGGTVSTAGGVNVDLDAGETVSCTFSDTLGRGDVVLHLDTVPDASPAVQFTADWGSFTLNDDGGDADGMWPDMTVEGLLAGTYQLVEGYTEGLAYRGIACDDPDGGTTVEDVGAIVTLDVDPGETIECTFTNDVAAPQPKAAFHVTLDAVPDDPVDVTLSFVGHSSTFTLDDDPADPTRSIVEDRLDADVGSQTYEAAIPAGWQVKSLACNDPDGGSTTDPAKARMTLDLDDGEDVSCTLAIEPIPVGPPPGPTCNGKAATIVGKPGDTTIRGTQGPDVIVDLDGANRIDGRGGNDTICTGPGADIINAGGGDDWVDAGDGANTVDGGSGNDTLRAGSGDDVIIGDAGNDDVVGGEGNNLVSTGSGDDHIVTGDGDDRIDGGKNFDTCQPGGGVNGVRGCEA
jgi:Ca2+-binding RTX toxin-like protein